MKTLPHDDVIRQAISGCDGLDYIQAGIFDLNGQLRGKRLPASSLTKILSSGFNIPYSVQNLDITGADITDSRFVFETGDQDGCAVWTGHPGMPIGHLSQPSMLFLMSLHHHDGSPFAGCPRAALKAAVDGAAEQGFFFTCGFEVEFTLLSADGSPFASSTDILSLLALDSLDSFFSQFLEACSGAGIIFESVQSEASPGQFEIVMPPDKDIVGAADRLMLIRHMLSSYAAAHGMTASMKAKPVPDGAGNGMHVHISLSDEQGANLFAQQDEVLGSAVAGLLDILQEATLIFAPTPNAFDRLTPYSHAPISICWGMDNRTAAVRVPASEPSARRIELRVAGMDANPYLVLLVSIQAMLRGIDGKCQPPAPIEGNSYNLSLPVIPASFDEALALFSASETMKQMMPDVLHEMFVSCKQQDGMISS